MRGRWALGGRAVVVALSCVQCAHWLDPTAPNFLSGHTTSRLWHAPPEIADRPGEHTWRALTEPGLRACYRDASAGLLVGPNRLGPW